MIAVSQTPGFVRLCLVACAVIVGLIVLGGVVRATDSGLGCPDWPTCHGRLIPQWEKHTLIEYSHRLTASVAGVLVLGIAGWAWRSYRRVPAVLYPSLLALALIIAQAGLGGVAVLNDLPPEVVAVHLGLAATILGLLLLVTMTAMDLQRPFATARAGPGVRRLAVYSLVVTFALLLVGSYVSGADYGLACSGWPLCNGDVVPGSDSTSVQVVFLHRLLAMGLGVLLVSLVALTWKSRAETPGLLTLTTLALAVYSVQAVLGAANVWSNLSDEVGAAHLAGGSLLWLLLAVLTIRTQGIYRLLPRAAGEATPGALAAGSSR